MMCRFQAQEVHHEKEKTAKKGDGPGLGRCLPDCPKRRQGGTQVKETTAQVNG